MNGTHWRDFQKSTTARTIASMLLMPRLPTPIATSEPGFRFAPKPAAFNSRWTSPGISARRRLGYFWPTRSMRERFTDGLYQFEADSITGFATVRRAYGN